MSHLVLDIDGTLILESDDPDILPEARPYLKEFLTFAFDTFETVSLWSAAGRRWVELVDILVFRPILREIGKEWYLVWDEKRCVTQYSQYDDKPNPCAVKPLKKLFRPSDYPHTKHNTLVVDNTPSTYKLNYGNAVAVPTYKPDSKDDKHLLLVIEHIKAKVDRFKDRGSVR